MNSRLLLTVVVLSLLALLALIGLQRALEEAVEEREKSQQQKEEPAGSRPGVDRPESPSGEVTNDTAPINLRIYPEAFPAEWRHATGGGLTPGVSP